MGSRKWLGLVASVVLVSVCYGAMTPKAENNMGRAYKFGLHGVPQNFQKSVYWFRKAARQGNASAEDNLGFAYDSGMGVPKNYQKAVYWWRKAARQGKADADNFLADAYKYGQGVPKNHQRSAYWSRKAYNRINGSR